MGSVKKKVKKTIQKKFCIDCSNCIFNEVGVFWHRQTIYRCSKIIDPVTSRFILCEKARKAGEECGINGTLFFEVYRSTKSEEEEI